MQLFTITNKSLFMKDLLSEKETVFDQFLLSEAVIMMGNTYTIDGHINKGFFSEEEIEIQKQQAADNGRLFCEDMVRWEYVKGFCYACIKGKKTPLSLKISFCLAPENVNRFLHGFGTGMTSDMINSLNVNIKYNGSALTCTTAVSLKLFTMDKSLEHSWDEMFSRFLTTHGYEYEW